MPASENKKPGQIIREILRADLAALSSGDLKTLAETLDPSKNPAFAEYLSASSRFEKVLYTSAALLVSAGFVTGLVILPGSFGLIAAGMLTGSATAVGASRIRDRRIDTYNTAFAGVSCAARVRAEEETLQAAMQQEQRKRKAAERKKKKSPPKPKPRIKIGNALRAQQQLRQRFTESLYRRNPAPVKFRPAPRLTHRTTGR